MKRNAVAWVALIVAIAALLSSRTMLTSAPAVQEIPAEGQRIAQQLSSAFQAVAEFSKPSVVQITTTRKPGLGNAGPMNINPFGEGGPGQGQGQAPGNAKPMTPEEMQKFREQFKRFFEDSPFPMPFEPQQLPQPGLRGTGSGFIYDDQGHILTNNHVVADSDKIIVTFSDGKEVDAKLVATDPKTDVAVIKIEAKDHRPLPRGNSEKLKVGEWVLAVGSPFGLEQSVTAGIVSAVGRGNLGILGRDGYGDFLQTDCAINPGNSGGPLIDMQGRVIGINTAIATATRANAGVGFSIPINFASKIADQLIKGGKVKRAQIGILFGAVNREIIEAKGLPKDCRGIIIGQVIPDSPAEKAGLKPDDVIVKYENTPITDVESFRNRIADSPIGQACKLQVLRDGKTLELPLTLGDAEVITRNAEKLARNVFNRDNLRPDAPKNAQGDDDDNKNNNPKNAAPDQAGKGNRTLVTGFGMTLQEVDNDLAQRIGNDAKGLIVSSVKRGGPASKAGIEIGAIVDQVTVKGKPVNVSSLTEFEKTVGDAKEAVLHVFTPNDKDNGKFLTVTRD